MSYRILLRINRVVTVTSRGMPAGGRMLGGGVFINYRGEDSYSYGALLHAEMSRRFGPDLTFLDSESIPAGADYVAQLLARVRHASVVLAVIGSRWLTASGPRGRRIDDPEDWIRRELMEAFSAGVRVIPVLTDGAEMPTTADLPDQLAMLARCQYRRLRHRDASADLARLVAELASLDPDLAGAAAARASEAPGWPAPKRAAATAFSGPLPGWQPPDELPPMAGYFTGREEELARLVRVREPSAGPMVSAVNGMAGVGKTALVLRAARLLVDAGRFPDGAIFVDLRGFSNKTELDPATALDAILHSLGVPDTGIPAGIDARAALYRTVVARRTALIVLDNARDEGQVRQLLPGTGNSLVLITSRRKLAGLDDADHVGVDVLPVPDAVRLFRAMVDTREAGAAPTVEEIVRLCGRLPLAVRIAGARLRTTRALSADLLLAQLRIEQGRLNVLDDGERSVKAALAVSFRHLPAEQQRAFAVLGLHPGIEFEPYGTAALLGISPHRALRLLDALEQVSLADQPAAGRYTFHDLVREYTTTLDAGTAAERQAALGRLYGHYSRGASRAMDLVYPYETLYRPHGLPSDGAGSTTNGSGDDPRNRDDPDLRDQAEARRWLASEMNNLLAAAHHAASHGRPDHTIRQSATLHRHLRTLGKHSDAQALHKHALDFARNLGDPAGELEALVAIGFEFRIVGQYGAATEYLEEAISKARDVGSAIGEMRAATALGQVCYAQGAHGQAAASFHRALDLAYATGDRLGEVEARAGLGRVNLLQGRYLSAEECFEQALTIAQELGYPPGKLDAMIGLAYVAQGQGHYGAAAASFEQIRDLARSSGHLVGELNALVGLGNVHRLQHRHDAAADCYERVLQISRTIGDRHGELSALSGLADSRRLQGRNDVAKQYLDQMLQLSQAAGGRNFELEAYLGLGRTYRALGSPERALEVNLQALALAEELGQLPDQARALNGVAYARHALGQLGQARDLWQQALRILTDLGVAATDEVTAVDLQAAIDSTATESPPSASAESGPAATNASDGAEQP